MAYFTIDDCAARCAPGRLIRRIDKLMASWIEADFPAGDINFSQWVALKLVRDGRTRNPGELARELGHTTGAVTRLIDGLEQRGLLARNRAGGDRRVVSLVITAEGIDKVNLLAPAVVGPWNEVFAEFDRAEFEALVAGLSRLLAAVERKAGDVEELAA
ncbi:MarR family winged helix-turn-helix transcriptional regulator [Sphingomonas bacterium]|uniref:MarR family winged helix-turn-helix transcriptional regulator n=1 Tax=Sphingomonas bacterium TaxID=1895847 RepID=UPI001574FE9D|nr:MarR family transcriptional regulator [Sphingomonas bacterium]